MVGRSAAAEGVGRRVAVRRDGGQRAVAEEEDPEGRHGIGDVDRPVVVRVGGVGAGRRRPAEEEEGQGEDRVAQVDPAVVVRVAPVEGRGVGDDVDPAVDEDEGVVEARADREIPDQDCVPGRGSSPARSGP
jgi:hypothetical protein